MKRPNSSFAETDLTAHTTVSNRHFIWRDPDIFPQPKDEIFDPQFWNAQNALVGEAQGRGTT